MKKIIYGLIFYVLLLFCGCSNSGYVENKELVLTFSFGERTGIYTGEIEKGLPNGIGTFESTNDEGVKWKYIGPWINGVMEGYGVCEWDDGGKYEGEYKSGYAEGKGKWYQNGELIWEGDFSEGSIIALDREMIEISDDEPLKYVQLGTIGFQIPDSWNYEVINEKTLYMSIPNEENVGICYSVIEELNLEDEDLCDRIKNQIINECGSEYRLVYENYEIYPIPQYDLHYTFYGEGYVGDYYCNAISKKSNTYVLTTIQYNGRYDYSEAAKIIQNTMKSWESIQEDIQTDKNMEIKLQIIESMLRADLLGEIPDWNEIEKVINTVTAEEIINHCAPKNQIVLVEGIIDNISEDSFDLWMSCGQTYYKCDGLYYGSGLGTREDIKEGVKIKVYLETYADGSLKKSDGITYVRVLDEAVIEDIETLFKDTCPIMDYNTIMRNPNKAYGTICKTSGQVLQVIETKSYIQEFLIKTDEGNITYVSYLKDEDADNILEGDNVNIYGTFYMTQTYTTLLGESKTVPKISTEYVDIK